MLKKHFLKEWMNEWKVYLFLIYKQTFHYLLQFFFRRLQEDVLQPIKGENQESKSREVQETERGNTRILSEQQSKRFTELRPEDSQLRPGAFHERNETDNHAQRCRVGWEFLKDSMRREYGNVSKWRRQILILTLRGKKEKKMECHSKPVGSTENWAGHNLDTGCWVNLYRWLFLWSRTRRGKRQRKGPGPSLLHVT